MTISLHNFNELQRQIPLIQSCIDNPSLAACQKVYNKYALQAVVDLVHLNTASDTPLTANHGFSYLKLNKLER